MEKTQLKMPPKLNPLPSPYKPGPNSHNRRIPSSSSTYSINRQRAASTHNPAGAGNSPRSNLGKFSKSTASLSGSQPARRVIKSNNPQANTLNSNKRAKSASSLAPLQGKALCSPRQQVEPSKTNVFERLSANTTTRYSAVTKIVSPPTANVKKQLHVIQQPQRNNNYPIPNVKRHNSVIITKKDIPLGDDHGPGINSTGKLNSQKGAELTVGPAQLRRASVARIPAENTRIPRPAKVFTVSGTRSKSVGLHPQSLQNSQT